MSRNVSNAMVNWLATDARTFATCVKITRKDGTVWGFTDHDMDITYSGLKYASSTAYTPSAIQASNDLSTGNMEIDSLLIPSGGVVRQQDIEAGLWDNAAVLIFALNYSDLTMGQINLTGGNLGQFTIANGGWKVELRGFAQILKQTIAQMYSPTCRARFGDSRCKFNISTVTFTGSVTSIQQAGLQWTDTSLTQTGPNSEYIDTIGHIIPTAAPWQITVVPPSGSWQSSVSVVDGGQQAYSQVASNPANLQYSVVTNSDGSATYTFNSNNAGNEIFISFNYAAGVFAFGTVKFTSGQNNGYSFNIKGFSGQSVTLGLPTPFPIAVGDTYTIVEGCDKQAGTCLTRWNNLVNFRGEPYIPGPDVLLFPQS